MDLIVLETNFSKERRYVKFYSLGMNQLQPSCVFNFERVPLDSNLSLNLYSCLFQKCVIFPKKGLVGNYVILNHSFAPFCKSSNFEEN